ncbi:hypothetical protein DFJ43DRAFT_142068 [Lentinula guzmanii]|uniref:Uncharacterized protein n=1 Tax=Lentinula guzmanii TaxID=2804957 RepID=A0AA38J922_9AGAR|nr:hypothetical protein DFJ43DRAFT_142068 [Lentinula guzmanii]
MFSLCYLAILGWQMKRRLGSVCLTESSPSISILGCHLESIIPVLGHSHAYEVFAQFLEASNLLANKHRASFNFRRARSKQRGPNEGVWTIGQINLDLEAVELETYTTSARIAEGSFKKHRSSDCLSFLIGLSLPSSYFHFDSEVFPPRSW